MFQVAFIIKGYLKHLLTKKYSTQLLPINNPKIMNTPDRWLIHRRLAEDNDERLTLVTVIPEHITLIGADADTSRSLLAQRYPKATFIEYDPRTDFLQAAADMRKLGFWQKLAGKNVPQHCQQIEDTLPINSTDMLWANLSLITAADPILAFENWAGALKTDGLLFFTHFGVDTLQEVTSYLKQQGIAFTTPLLFDMHDLGDMLFHHGFYDPVMDTSKITLTYQSAESFWQDMDTLGLWGSLCFDNEAEARAAIEHAWQNGAFNSITLETVYGHAVKKRVLPENESLVQFYSKKP